MPLRANRIQWLRDTPWTVWLTAAVLAVIVLAAVCPQWLSTLDPDATDPSAALLPPGPGHLFGTDQLGRDIYTRTVYGARISLSIGAGATLIGFTLGAIVGVLASGPSRLLNGILMRGADILLAFPGLLLALVFIAVLGPGSTNTAVAIGLAGAPHYARLVRSQALVVRRSGYVEAARTLGQRGWRLTVRHILPNALAPLVVLAALGVGTGIIAAAGLSFLGLGAVPPTPEWGAMLADGRNLLSVAWWIAVFPGACITAAVVCVTILARYGQSRTEGRR